MSSTFDTKLNSSIQSNTNISVHDVENRIVTSLAKSFVDHRTVSKNDEVNTVEAIEKRAQNTRMMRSSIQVLRETKQLEDTENLVKFYNNIVDREECTEVSSDKIRNAKKKINQMADDIQRLRQKVSTFNRNLPINNYF